MTSTKPYKRIFRRNANLESPFIRTDWGLLLLVESLPRRISSYFEPLARSATEVGDTSVIVADESEPDEVVRCSWSPDEFSEAVFRFPLGALVFGDSCRWGMVITDEEFACLGGEPEVVQPVADALGGLGTVRRAFDAWLETADGLLFSSDKAVALRRLNRWEPSAHV